MKKHKKQSAKPENRHCRLDLKKPSPSNQTKRVKEVVP